MPWKDPIVEEVRKARDEYARQFDYDLDAIFRDLQEKQRQTERRIVACPPKATEAPDTQAADGP